MRCGIVLLVVLRLLIGVHAAAEDAKQANSALVQTFTTRKTVKLSDAVADFVSDLIRKNTGGVQDQYSRLTAATEKNAGGRFQTRPFEGIQWWVLQSSWDGDGDRSSNRGEYVYLARQQVIAGGHRTYSAPINVVARVRVLTAWTGRSDRGNVPDSETASPGTKVTLTFEGFLKSIPVATPQ
jgi:hypothetical protein